MFGKRTNKSIRPNLFPESKELVGADAIAQRAADNQAERNRPQVTQSTSGTKLVRDIMVRNRLANR